MIPLLVAEDVKRASATIHHEIDRLITDNAEPTISSNSSSSSWKKKVTFDATKYFFLSHHLADRFPSLWESTLVTSYQSPTPPPHLLDKKHILTHKRSSKERHNRGDECSSSFMTLFGNIVHRFVVALTTISLYFGTINIHLQRAVITVIQPTVLAGLCFAYYDIVGGEWLVAVPCVIVIVAVVSYQFRRRSTQSVAPIEEPNDMTNEKTDQYEGKDDVSISHLSSIDHSLSRMFTAGAAESKAVGGEVTGAVTCPPALQVVSVSSKVMTGGERTQAVASFHCHLEKISKQLNETQGQLEEVTHRMAEVETAYLSLLERGDHSECDDNSTNRCEENELLRALEELRNEKRTLQMSILLLRTEEEQHRQDMIHRITGGVLWEEDGSAVQSVGLIGNDRNVRDAPHMTKKSTDGVLQEEEGGGWGTEWVQVQCDEFFR